MLNTLSGYLPVDAVGNIQLPSQNDIIQYLPPEMLSLGTDAIGAIQSVMGTIQQAQPAIDLIAHIASGGVPDPQSVIGALSATAAIINPVAGAILGVAGEVALGVEKLTESVLDDLGLISHPPPTFPYIGFVKKGTHIPNGSKDAQWKTWDYWMQPIRSGWKWGSLPFNAETMQRERPMMGLLSNLGTYPKILGTFQGGKATIINNQPPPFDGPIGQNDFETFFFEMLKKDLEAWMNANPSMEPRKLLSGAAKIWNHLHLPGNVKTYSASEWPTGYDAFNVQQGAHPIEYILSDAGDMSSNALNGFAQSADDISVNMGTTIVPPKRVFSLKGLNTKPTPPPISIKAKAQINIPGSAAYNPNIPDSQDPCVLYDYMVKIGQQNSPQGIRLKTACDQQSTAGTLNKTSVPLTIVQHSNQPVLKKDNALLAASAAAVAGFAVGSLPGALIGAGLGYVTAKLSTTWRNPLRGG
jgi:hypothetical protein